MHIDQEVTIASPIDAVWAFMTDLPAVSGCVPGVELTRVLEDDAVAGTLVVKVGPIGLRMEGTVRLAERDEAARRAELRIDANDRRIGGGVQAVTTMRLAPVDAATTTLSVSTEATLMGRLGQFGQPIIRRKADEMARQFAANVAATLAARDGD